MAKKRPKAKVKPKRKISKPKGRSKPPSDPNEFAKWLVDRTTESG